MSKILATETVLKKTEEAQEQKCEDSCQVCQRVVYQIKFQGAADCEVNGSCRNTCYKIKEAWSTPWNPFEPFLKDMFGKCEICFRAGHCTISQCKEQERNELEVINRVLNANHLTAKISPELMVSFPEQADVKALPHIQKINPKVQHSLNKSIKTAVAIGTAEHLIPKVQNLVKNYFQTPQAAVKGGAFTVLNTGAVKGVSASNISYWNEHATQTPKQVATTQKVVAKLDQHVQELQKLKQNVAKGQHKGVSKVIKKEKKEIDRLSKKVQKLEHKLASKEKSLTKLANNPRIQDASVKAAINNSLNQVKQYSAAVHQAKSGIVKDKKQIKGF